MLTLFTVIMMGIQKYSSKKVHSNDKQYSLWYFASKLKPYIRLIDLKQNQFLCSQAKECGQSST